MHSTFGRYARKSLSALLCVAAFIAAGCHGNNLTSGFGIAWTTLTAEEAAGIDVRAGSHPRKAGDRLPASYINFYIANKCVVMPLYDKRYDAAAARTLKRLFPSRKVVGIATREVLLGGGNIHCITQQVPHPKGR